MVGGHHRLNGHESEPALGDRETWHAAVHGVAESNTTEGLNKQRTESFFLIKIPHIVIMLLLLLSLRSCPTLCDPIDGSPPGSTISGILQARTLGWDIELMSF